MFDKKEKEKSELHVQQLKQIERRLIGEIVPHKNHTVFEIERSTGKIEVAKFIEKTYVFGGKENSKREIYKRNDYDYVSALSKKTAPNKWRKGKDGSKEFSKNPIKINLF